MDDLPLTIKTFPGQHAGQLVIALSGPLTLNTALDFHDVVRAEKARSMIIDMSEVPYVDSAGLASIMGAHISCANSGRRFALAGVRDNVRRMIRVAGVEQVLAIFPTVQEAQQNLA